MKAPLQTLSTRAPRSTAAAQRLEQVLGEPAGRIRVAGERRLSRSSLTAGSAIRSASSSRSRPKAAGW